MLSIGHRGCPHNFSRQALSEDQLLHRAFVWLAGSVHFRRLNAPQSVQIRQPILFYHRNYACRCRCESIAHKIKGAETIDSAHLCSQRFTDFDLPYRSTPMKWPLTYIKHAFCRFRSRVRLDRSTITKSMQNKKSRQITWRPCLSYIFLL